MDVESELAYNIFIIEKEFNVGPVTDDFLYMKFLNLFDEYNIRRYNNMINGKSGSEVQTMRG